MNLPVKSGKYEKNKRATKNKGKRLDRGVCSLTFCPGF
jgi:hypothetical protein